MACEAATRRVVREEQDGGIAVLASSFQGRPLGCSTGKKLDRIVHGFANTANVAVGGDDWKTVYFCTRQSRRIQGEDCRRASAC